MAFDPKIAQQNENQHKLESRPKYKTLRELKLQRLESEQKSEAEGAPGGRVFLASEAEAATAAPDRVGLAFEDLVHLYERAGRGVCFVDLKGVQLIRGQTQKSAGDNSASSTSAAASAVHKVENIGIHLTVGSSIWHDKNGEGKIVEIDPSDSRGRPFQICFAKDNVTHTYTQGQVCMRQCILTIYANRR